ncbi:hypothetical protein ACFQ14_08520 [Pseudahrensia aquimaris]|uniref:Uncharacterized protein n=1 Tax=Pseudahrensia aquimaris TaxID=744461 RepID=A0ABW3FFF5_9HYPH
MTAMRVKSGALTIALALFLSGTAHATDPFLKEAEAVKSKPAAKKPVRKRVAPRRAQRRLVTLPAFRPGTDVVVAGKVNESEQTPATVDGAKPAVKPEIAATPVVEAERAEREVARIEEPVKVEKAPDVAEAVKEPVETVVEKAPDKPKTGFVYKAPEAPAETVAEQQAKVETPEVAIAKPEPADEVKVKVAEKLPEVAPKESVEASKPPMTPESETAVAETGIVGSDAVVAMAKPEKEVKVEQPPKAEVVETKPVEPEVTTEEPVQVEAEVAVVEPAPVEAAPKEEGSEAQIVMIDPEGKASTGATVTVPAAKPASFEAPVELTSVQPAPALGEISTIDFSQRPTSYIKALDDQRLSKLPGRKTRGFKAEEVIAIRHHALMLLTNRECTGITEGGRAATPGMLYIRCSDDPTFIRQFPLEEQSW